MAKGTLQIEYEKLVMENIELKERIKKLEAGLFSIRKSTEIMEARRLAKQALKGE